MQDSGAGETSSPKSTWGEGANSTAQLTHFAGLKWDPEDWNLSSVCASHSHQLPLLPAAWSAECFDCEQHMGLVQEEN